MVYQIFNDGIDRYQSLSSPSPVTVSCASSYSSSSDRSSAHARKFQRHNARRVRGKTRGSLLSLLLPNYLSIQTETRLATFLIVSIKIILFLYDLISLPIYFVFQRPDKRAREAQRVHSRQVDAKTWVRMHQQVHPIVQHKRNKRIQNTKRGFSPAEGHNNASATSKGLIRAPSSFMGATLDEIFAQSLLRHWTKSCLGYRAVVTCPMLVLNELGEHVMQDKSFRSDYTWYTFGQVGQRVQDIASGLYHQAIYPQARALFLAATSLEWFCTAQACFQMAIQVVLAPEISDCKLLGRILSEARAECLFVSCDKLALLCQLIDTLEHTSEGCNRENTSPECRCFALKRIIIIDWQFTIDFSEPVFNQLAESLRDLQPQPTIRVLSMGQIEESGIEHPIELRCSRVLSQEMEATNNAQTVIDGHWLSPPCSSLPQHCTKQQPESVQKKENPLELSNVARSEQTNLVGINDSAADFSTSSSMSSSWSSSSVDSFSASTPLNRKQLVESTNAKPHRLTKTCPSALLNRRCDYLRRMHSDSALDANSDGGETTTTSEEFLITKQLAKPQDVAIISYSFGPLGQLKPILHTHSQLSRCTNPLFLDGMVSNDEIHCTVMELDNLVEFMTEMCVFSRGGSIGYSCNLDTLFYDGKQLFARDKSDLQALEPSFLVVRPYILERLRASVQNYLLSHLNPLVGFVMRNALYEYKKYWAQRHYGTPLVDRLFCSQLKQLFGKRLDYILCNGATDCSETKDFFAFMLDLPVIELYGPEETSVSLVSADDIWDYKRSVRLQSSASRAVSGYGWRLFQFDRYNDDDDDDGDDGDTSEDDRSDVPYHVSSNRLSGEKVNDLKTKQALEVARINSKQTKMAAPSSGNKPHKSKPSGDMRRLLPPRVNKNNYQQDFSKNILFTSRLLYPTYGTRIRLEDWEDFRSSDQPFARGRLLIGGDVVCQGYLERAQLFNELFHVDSNLVSWFRTNDIARAFPNGSFEIVSSISDLIKMVDGQFVSLSQIEQILRNSRFVDNVCATCGGDRSFVINLVVPNLRRLALKSPNEANLKSAIGIDLNGGGRAEPLRSGNNKIGGACDEPDELVDVEFRREVCNDRLLSEFVSEHLSELLNKSGLSSIQNKFLLVPEIWTPESELVTPAFEPKRSAIQKFYAADIHSIVRTMQLTSNSRRLSARRYKLRKSSGPPMLV